METNGNGSDAWEQVVRDCQEAFEKAASGWAPPVGEYTVLMTDLYVGSFPDRQDPKKIVVSIQPTWQILDGQFDGTPFKGDRYTNRTPGALGFTRGFLEKLNGEAIPSFLDSIKHAKTLVGRVTAMVKVTYKKGNDGVDYPNTRLTQLLETAAA